MAWASIHFSSPRHSCSSHFIYIPHTNIRPSAPPQSSSIGAGARSSLPLSTVVYYYYSATKLLIIFVFEIVSILNRIKLPLPRIVFIAWLENIAFSAAPVFGLNSPFCCNIMSVWLLNMNSEQLNNWTPTTNYLLLPGMKCWRKSLKFARYFESQTPQSERAATIIVSWRWIICIESIADTRAFTKVEFRESKTLPETRHCCLEADLLEQKSLWLFGSRCLNGPITFLHPDGSYTYIHRTYKNIMLALGRLPIFSSHFSTA